MTARSLRAVPPLAVLFVLAPAAAQAGVDRWSEAGPGGPVAQVAMDPSDPSRLFAAVGCEVFASDDGGESWQRRSAVPGCGQELSLLAVPVPGALYTCTGVGGIPTLLRSDDGGRSWRPLTAAYVDALLVDPGDPSLILAGGSGIVRSSDGGENWERVLEERAGGGPFFISYHVSSIYRDPGDPAVLRANVQVISPGFFDEACYVSLDGGRSWNDQLHSCFGDPVEWLAGLRGRPDACEVHGPFSIVCSTEFEPTAEVPPIPGDTLVVVPSQPPVLYASDGSTAEVRRSRDGGHSWELVAGWTSLLPDEPGSPRRAPRLFIHPEVPERVYVRSHLGPLHRATFVGADPLLSQGSRLETRAAWRPPGGGAAGAAPAAIGGETGGFWFRRPDNLELGVKVLDGREVNHRFWVFQTALSNLEYEVTVTDTITGESRSWLNPLGRFAARADTGTFLDPPAGGAPGITGAAVTADRAAADGPPASLPGTILGPPHVPAAGAASSCTPSARTLCLLDRFEVELSWRDGGAPRPAFAAPVGEAVGAFRFAETGSLQLLVKALDARAIDGRFWVFYGGLTDRELSLTLTDSVTGTTRTYETAGGELTSGADTETFLAP